MLTLALSLATLLLVAVIGSLPAIVRVIRMRRLERLLGGAYWSAARGMSVILLACVLPLLKYRLARGAHLAPPRIEHRET